MNLRASNQSAISNGARSLASYADAGSHRNLKSQILSVIKPCDKLLLLYATKVRGLKERQACPHEDERGSYFLTLSYFILEISLKSIAADDNLLKSLTSSNQIKSLL